MSKPSGARKAQEDEAARRGMIAIAMREAGETFASIGVALGVGTVRARQIYLRALDRPEDTAYQIEANLTWSDMVAYAAMLGDEFGADAKVDLAELAKTAGLGSAGKT